jgi:hypothetical protein
MVSCSNNRNKRNMNNMSATEPPNKALIFEVITGCPVHQLVWSLIFQLLNIHYGQFMGWSWLYCNLIEPVLNRLNCSNWLNRLCLHFFVSFFNSFLFIYLPSNSIIFETVEPIKPWFRGLTGQVFKTLASISHVM